MNHKKMIQIMVSLLIGITLSQGQILTELHGTKGQADSQLQALVKKFGDIGFSIAAKNEHLEMHYYKQFHEKNLDLLDFFRIYNKEGVRELLLHNPDFGAFVPFNFLAYKKPASADDENMTWYGHLDSDVMLQIIGEKDEASREKFKAMIDKLDKFVVKEMKPSAEKKLEFDKPLPKHPLLKMVKKFEATDDIEGYVEEFIMEHDSLFTQHQFVIAGFLDLKFEYDDVDLDFDKYDAYWVSSLCHFEFSNAVFNHWQPQAGVYAPCSIYFYIPKGKNEIHVGYATVENWITSTGIKDKDQLAYMKKVADEVQKTFEELGFEVEGEAEEPAKVDEADKPAAKVPSPQSDLAAEVSQLKVMIEALTKEVKSLQKILLRPTAGTKNKEKKESAAALPQKTFKTAKMELSDQAPEKLSAYYAANPQTIEALKGRLKENGFEILGTNEILKGKTVVTVTNDTLKKSNTFLAALNLLVDGTDEIRVQNPSYFAAAYLGDAFHYGQYKDVLKALQAALGDMYLTADMMDYAKLKTYSFMPDMAHFADFVEVSEGDDLADKVSGDNGKNYIAYTVKLPDGALLVGHKMRTHSNKFLTKIGETKNAQLLPYQSIIKDGKAYMMDPTYYLALSLPLLTMEDFMKIASTPDDIGLNVGRAYR